MSVTLFKKGFGSDNHSGVHPTILQSLCQANISHTPSYGMDPLSVQLNDRLIQLFGKETEGFFVFNGTAANTLSLKALVNSWNSVLVADISHLNVDECGAPEAIAGIKLIPVKTNSEGKLTVEALEKHILRLGDQHYSQVGCISVTQPTELGTVYTIEELEEISAFAKKNKLKLHMDGARLTNATEHLRINFKQLREIFPMDALSFGGTKNGLMGAEMVLLWEESYKKNFRYIRKQAMQLPSKTRFFASQFLTWLEKDLYKEIANHSHEMACQLKGKLGKFQEIEVLYPVESNAVFIRFPKPWTNTLKKSHFFYIWDPEVWSARLMTSFDTTEKDIEDFCNTIQSLIPSQKEHSP